ncbi:MAG: DNA methyltransferase [Candidatus Hodarchaeota archaeon]
MTIEENFPLKKIQSIAKVESQRRQFYRPIYSIHKSWARRPGSTFRAIGLADLYSGPLFNSDEPGRGAFYQNHVFNDKIVLDPFCGGGTTIVEFNRLGVKTVGIDVNPIACFTTKKEIDNFDEELFDNEVEKLLLRIGNRIKSFYKTECPKCNSSKADIMYTFWVRRIICPSCQSEEDLFKYYIIGKKQRKHPATMLICPRCDHLFYSTNNLDMNVECEKCNYRFIPKLGNCKFKHFTCTKCSKKFRLVELLNGKQNSLSERQIAIEYFCPICRIRGYKPIVDKDVQRFIAIDTEFEGKKVNLIYPRENLPEYGKNINNLRNYGFTRFSDFFNSRQLLSLSLLFEEIIRVPNQNIKEFLLAAFSSSLEFHTVLCPYNYTMKQIVNLFNYQSFLVPTMFVENNVWGTKKGNGSFITYLERIKKAKKFCQYPFEIAIKDGKIKKIPIPEDKILANTVTSFQSLLKSNSNETLLITDSSEDLLKLGIIDESIDMVVTDPPYFDFISYSELANFFYVWLKIALKEKYPQFDSDLIETSREIGSLKKRKSFIIRMTNVFQECYRVLKPHSLLVFTFHHSNASAWAMIIQALVNSKFTITASFPIYSEFKARPAGGPNLDIIIVCRKGIVESTLSDNSSANSLKEEIKKALKDTSNARKDNHEIALWESIFAAFLPKISEIYYHNSSMNLEQFIDEIFFILSKVKISKE